MNRFVIGSALLALGMMTAMPVLADDPVEGNASPQEISPVVLTLNPETGCAFENGENYVFRFNNLPAGKVIVSMTVPYGAPKPETGFTPVMFSADGREDVTLDAQGDGSVEGRIAQPSSYILTYTPRALQGMPLDVMVCLEK